MVIWLYRLGEAEKAASHYKLAKSEASFDDISKAKALQVLISNCSQARRLKDWNAVLKESQSAISSGADSAPQVHLLARHFLIIFFFSLNFFY